MKNFYQNIFKTLNEKPDQVFIKWQEGDLQNNYTGKNILQKTSSYCYEIEKKGIKKGEVVMLAIPVSFEMICIVLAIMACGAIPMLPPAGVSGMELIRILRRQRVTAIVLKKNTNLIQSIILKLLNLKKIISNIETYPKIYTPQEVDGNQAALISHSSGSTGNAKTIFRTHNILTAQHLALKSAFPPFQNQKDFPLFPNILLHNLSCGITSVLPAIPNFNVVLMEPSILVTQIRKEEITTLTGNVFYFKKLTDYLSNQSVKLHTVRSLGVGGSPVPHYLVRKLQLFFPQATIYIIYGSTEAEPISIEKVDEKAINMDSGYPVGRLHKDILLSFADSCYIKVGDKKYQGGEIQVKGDHVIPSKNQEWLSTGDYGFIDEEGRLFLTGRKGNQRIHEGIQHYQIEHLLGDLPGINKVAAISRKDGFDIFIEGRAHKEIIYERLNRHFPKGIIKGVKYVKNIPVDARHHSKILYGNLK